MIPARDFLVLDFTGQTIASSDWIEDALTIMRLLPSAQSCIRASDYETMARKGRPWKGRVVS